MDRGLTLLKPNHNIGGAVQFTVNRITTYGRMIKFSHTIFALPFALAAVVLAARRHALDFTTFFWILVAMVGARSAAMGFNRLADASIDAQNPRTAIREIPSGRLSVKSAILFVILFSALFILACAFLGKLCLFLAVPTLLLLFSYSYTKRFTWLSHLYLGFVISLAPLGAWIAVTNTFSWEVLTLCLALMAYIAGFDILYACQDQEFDQKLGLHSIPAQFGIKKALFIAKAMHLLAWISFWALKYAFDLNGVYLAAVIIIGGLLICEHLLVRPDNLRHINIAFFHVNSIISVSLFGGVFLDVIFIN